MTDDGYIDVRTHDGRTLEVLVGGEPDGFPLLYHSGSPSAAVHSEAWDRTARDLGLRLVTYSRPGYGRSTPRPAVGAAQVKDDVLDMAAILDHLAIDEFVTIGHSGGGPRALAAAALLGDQCRGAVSLAGVAPPDAEGLDWTAGMAAENVEEYDTARRGPEAYRALLERAYPPMFAASADEIAAAFGGLVTEVDKAAITGELAEELARSFHHAGAQGVAGALEDGLTIMAPWGFDLAEIDVPVAIWQGRQDAMVPYAHGAWLAAHVPTAQPHLFEDEGHLSLVAQLERILDDLIHIAGLA
ncbi:alpha/beta fold hydrolase [Nocardioides sp. LS1]|uniref:alpha/beta fold hydrolase n=1 Tax=Nocardioides sp. LS1 TaxID=1027620 RepID=UPI000F624B3B|nr:alpha/beta hydrolase [Nocardioides sp. LS1]GCD91433.1 alpha/beta hydrolase [Nocardioides sp. LS1]